MAENYEEWKARTGQAGAKGFERSQQAAAAAPAPAAPAPATPAPAGPAPAPRNLPGAPGGGGAPAPAAPGGAGPGLPGFKSFADWQAANRAEGGHGTESSFLASGGVMTDADRAGQAAESGSRFHVGSGRADGSTGAPNNQANMTEEQRIDYAMQNIDSLDAHGSPERARQQWKDWQRSFDPACPSENPYQAEDGSGCVEKPDNSNSGGAGGRGGGGGGRGGGGGAGGAGAGAGAGAPGDTGGIAALMESNLKGLLDGSGTRYTPEVMQGILAQIKQQMEGSKARQRGQASREAAGRGMSRAGATQARLADITRGAEAGFTGEFADLLTKKVDADFKDKMAGIDRAQKYVDSLKLELYRKDMTALQRQQLRAQISIAKLNIDAQRQNLNTSIQGSKDQQAAAFGFDQLNRGA